MTHLASTTRASYLYSNSSHIEKFHGLLYLLSVVEAAVLKVEGDALGAFSVPLLVVEKGFLNT